MRGEQQENVLKQTDILYPPTSNSVHRVVGAGLKCAYPDRGRFASFEKKSDRVRSKHRVRRHNVIRRFADDIASSTIPSFRVSG